MKLLVHYDIHTDQNRERMRKFLIDELHGTRLTESVYEIDLKALLKTKIQILNLDATDRVSIEVITEKLL